MSYAQLGAFFPPIQFATSYTLSSSLIDATGEMWAFAGRVWFAEGSGTKAIRKVHFRFGAVTKAGGSALTVSLQDASTAAGPPTQPDGTPDQTVAIANADAGFVSNAWYTTGNLSADRTVTYGDLLSVVIEFDGAGRLGADAVNISNLALSSGWVGNVPALLTGSWLAIGVVNNVLLEFSDGTFGRIDQGYIVSAVGQVTINSGTTPDEVALKFTPPWNCKVDGATFLVDPVAAGDFDVVLYAGTTALKTVPIDINTMRGIGGNIGFASFAEETLAAGTTYYLSLKPTTTTSLALDYSDVASAAHLAALPGGTAFHYAQRTDAGAWSPTTTRLPAISVRLSSIVVDASSGGLIRHPGMSGGLNA